jgi:tRNA-2-methylthio-N6-dimethylallyladenosine synthase
MATSDQLIPLGKRQAPARPTPAANGLRVYVETYGCQMNVADSDLIGSVLAEAGYAATERAEDADVILVNTCAVREKAEERSSRARPSWRAQAQAPGTVLRSSLHGRAQEGSRRALPRST